MELATLARFPRFLLGLVLVSNIVLHTPCNCSPSFGFRGCFHRCLSLQCISKLATSRRVLVPVHCFCASRVDWKQLSKEPSHSGFIGRTAVESTMLYTELWWCSRPVAGSALCSGYGTTTGSALVRCLAGDTVGHSSGLCSSVRINSRCEWKGSGDASSGCGIPP